MANKMALNLKKCLTMDVCFSRQRPESTILTPQADTLQCCESVKLLGVHIQANLKWNSHVEYMVKRANSRLYLLRTLKYYILTIPDLVNIYISFVRPVLEYATPVWSGGLSKGQCQMIEQVQKRACRVILGAQYTGYDAALTQCGLRRLEERRSRLCLSFAKSLQLPSCRLNYLLPPKRHRAYNTRNGRTRETCNCRTNRFYNSPMPYLSRILQIEEH